MCDFPDNAIKTLPARRSASPSEFIDKFSLLMLVGMGIGVYCAIILFFTAIQMALIRAGIPMVVRAGGGAPAEVNGFIDLLYFNLVTVITIGYGDLTPSSYGRIVSCLEAVAGLIVFGTVLSAAVLKLTLPRKSTVVFSSWCYFTLDDRRFVVVFVNTSLNRIVNADLCSVLKLGRTKWKVRPPYRTPYIGSSAWTYSVNFLSEHLPEEGDPEDLSDLVFYPEDSLKVGISGALGVSLFTTSVKYSLADCWVLDSKSDLPIDLLENPHFGDPEFEQAFHFIPPNGVRFLDYALERGARLAQPHVATAAAAMVAGEGRR